MQFKNSIASRILELGGKVTVRSALNPVLWLSLIISVPGLGIFCIVDESPQWLPYLIFVPVGLVSIGFLYLLFKDPDKLQSEDYQLKRRSLEMILEKGESSPTLASNIKEIISNPEVPLLPEPDGDKE